MNNPFCLCDLWWGAEDEQRRSQNIMFLSKRPVVLFDLARRQPESAAMNYCSCSLAFCKFCGVQSSHEWLTVRRFFRLSTISSKSTMSWLRSKTCPRSWRFASRSKFNWSSFWMFCDDDDEAADGRKIFKLTFSKVHVVREHYSLPCKTVHLADLCSRSTLLGRWNVWSESKVEVNLFPSVKTARRADSNNNNKKALSSN